MRPLLLTPLLFLAACSSTKKLPMLELESDHKFEVSVESLGKPVENPEQQLIHRYELSDASIKALRVSELQMRREFDGAGKVKGLRLSPDSAPPTLTTLGLKPGDVLTAVGIKRIHNPEDVMELMSALAKERNASMTIERAGVPHKLYYEVGSGS